MKFRDLTIGQEFDFIDAHRSTFNSFYDRCRKESARTYVSIHDGTRYRVGSINAIVHNYEVKS